MNPRPPGYEPDELPDCSTPRQRALFNARDIIACRGTVVKPFWQFLLSFLLSDAGNALSRLFWRAEGFTKRRECAMITDENRILGNPQVPARRLARWDNRERGVNPRQDRCCDAERRAYAPLAFAEKAARSDDAKSEDLPVERISFLRTKERYVPVARSDGFASAALYRL